MNWYFNTATLEAVASKCVCALGVSLCVEFTPLNPPVSPDSDALKPASPDLSVWCLEGNGGMDPHSSPYIISNNSLHNPFPIPYYQPDRVYMVLRS